MIADILVAVMWLVIGAYGVHFWWTRDPIWDYYNLPPDSAFRNPGAAYIGALLGPLAWILGWLIHRD
jgi:hypothetical protein